MSKDVEDDIQDALKELSEAPEEEKVEDEVEQPQEPEEAEEVEETTEASDPPEEAPIEEVEPEEEPEEAVEYPNSWSALQRENWSKIPKGAQDYIRQREEDFHKQLTKHDEERNFGRSVQEIASPYVPIIQAEGGTVEGAFKDLLNTAYVLRQGNAHQKAALVRDAIQQYNIDPRLVFGQQQNISPHDVQQMVEQGINQFKQTYQQESTKAEQDRINQEVEAFAKDPKHEFFNDVWEYMVPLLESGRAKDLAEAYEQAIWTHPQVRPVLIQRQNEAEKEKRKEKVEVKKKAASSLNGSPDAKASNSKKSDPKATVEDDVRAALQEAKTASRV